MKIRWYRNLLLGVWLVSSAYAQDASPAQLPDDPQNFHIFLMMGQSNMTGTEAVDGEPDTETDSRIWKLNSWGSWELAQDPICNDPAVGVGPGLSFAKRLLEEQPDISIGLVPLAVGATHIDQWLKGSELYEIAIAAAQRAQRLGTIKAVLWHQGEHDGIFFSDANTYLPKIKRLTDDLRKDLRNVDLPIITGGFVNGIRYSQHSAAPVTWEYIKENARQTYLTGYARTSDLPYLPDNLHFSTVGQRMLGPRYAEEYLRLIGHWREKGKERLDEEAEVIEGDWKFHPSIGLYNDLFFPYVKHAQMGWVIVDFFADGSMKLSAPYFEQNAAQLTQTNFLRTYLDPPEDGLYLYRENIDQERIHQPGDIYYLNLLADPDTDAVFYNHTTGTWSASLGSAPVFNSIASLYAAASYHLLLTQQASQRTIELAQLDNWSDVQQAMLKTYDLRVLAIFYAFDTYFYAIEHYQGQQRDYWVEQVVQLLSQVDPVVLDAQIQYVEFLIRLANAQ
jgi:hypothetical protein